MIYCILGFPGGSDSKESSCNAGDLGSIPGLGRSPGGGHGNAFQYSCLENRHGWRSLAVCSPWGCKELDMTKCSTYYIFKNCLIKSNNIEDVNSFLNFSESSPTCKQNLQIFGHQ